MGRKRFKKTPNITPSPNAPEKPFSLDDSLRQLPKISKSIKKRKLTKGKKSFEDIKENLDYLSLTQIVQLAKTIASNKVFIDDNEFIEKLDTQVQKNLNEFSSTDICYLLKFYRETKFTDNVDFIINAYFESDYQKVENVYEYASILKSLIFFELLENSFPAYETIKHENFFNFMQYLSTRIGALKFDCQTEKCFAHSYTRYIKYNYLGIQYYGLDIEVLPNIEEMIKNHALSNNNADSNLEKKANKKIKKILEANFQVERINSYSEFTYSYFDSTWLINKNTIIWVQIDPEEFHCFMLITSTGLSKEMDAATYINTRLMEENDQSLIRFKPNEIKRKDFANNLLVFADESIIAQQEVIPLPIVDYYGEYKYQIMDYVKEDLNFRKKSNEVLLDILFYEISDLDEKSLQDGCFINSSYELMLYLRHSDTCIFIAQDVLTSTKEFVMMQKIIDFCLYNDEIINTDVTLEGALTNLLVNFLGNNAIKFSQLAPMHVVNPYILDDFKIFDKEFDMQSHACTLRLFINNTPFQNSIGLYSQ